MILIVAYLSFMWHQPCQRCLYTTSVDIQKTRYKNLVTHVQSHASSVSLLESGEQRYTKAINSSNRIILAVTIIMTLSIVPPLPSLRLISWDLGPHQ